ncbi:hypothetical protein QBC46DRAFT_408866 [Diplogelasinospora grovesii]|uniref:Uncharacterized protein n=1 Tax=Diplogelasinospora grovesii TaxID=303347 RepID=A0AAN6N7U8_9PEZI|nr:hypothetical protein QBC46DRAFT_408866 [Diplogelasinospora grovesii]
MTKGNDYIAIRTGEEPFQGPAPDGRASKQHASLEAVIQAITRHRGVLFGCLGMLTFGFAVSCAFVFGRRSVSLTECGQRLSAWSPALDAIEYYQTIWDGGFLAPSIYRGTPTTELDAAWDRITTGCEGILRIAKSDLGRLKRSSNEDLAGLLQPNKSRSYYQA